MKLKNITIAVLAVAGIATAGLVGVKAVAAQTNKGNSLVQEIADKFHLNLADVQKVFDQHRAEHQALVQQNFDNRLTQLVNQGKITSQQKDLILAKTAEVKTQVDNIRNNSGLTMSQKRTQIKQIWSDLKTWAKNNNIDEKYLVFRMMGGSGRGPFH